MFFTFKCYLFTVLILLSSIMISQTFGKVYVWTDDNGIKHFSNIAPPIDKQTNQVNESTEPLPQGMRFKVTKVYDGDTVQLRGAGLEFRVRLVGIDTPETGGNNKQGQPYSRRAQKTLSQLIMGKEVTLKQYGTGGYNRVLAELFSGRVNINLIMLKKGLAEVYRGKLPQELDAAAYKSAEAKAKIDRAGIWSLGDRYQSPRQWRRENPRK